MVEEVVVGEEVGEVGGEVLAEEEGVVAVVVVEEGMVVGGVVMLMVVVVVVVVVVEVEMLVGGVVVAVEEEMLVEVVVGVVVVVVVIVELVEVLVAEGERVKRECVIIVTNQGMEVRHGEAREVKRVEGLTYSMRKALEDEKQFVEEFGEELKKGGVDEGLEEEAAAVDASGVSISLGVVLSVSSSFSSTQSSISSSSELNSLGRGGVGGGVEAEALPVRGVVGCWVGGAFF